MKIPLSPFPWPLIAVVAEHENRVRTKLATIAFPDDGGPAFLSAGGAEWEFRLANCPGSDSSVSVVSFEARVVSGHARQVAVGLTFFDKTWSTENFVLIPGAVYGGNRFSALRRDYPPSIRDIGQRGDRLVLDIGDIPRLSLEPGTSHLDQTSPDAATPGLGIFYPALGKSLLLLTGQKNDLGPFGLEIIESDDRAEAQVLLLTPGILHPVPGDDVTSGPAIGNTALAHLHPENARPVDVSAGGSVRFSFQLHWFPCDATHVLFDRLLSHRAALFPTDKPLPDLLPFSAAWDILKEKHNTRNWDEKFGIYKIGLPWGPNQPTQFWQNGWVGGGATTLPMIQDGDPILLDRAVRNLTFLIGPALSDAGFFKACMGDDGEWSGDKWGDLARPWGLVRRNGDCLHFLLRQFLLLRERIPSHPFLAELEPQLRKAADAWCGVWEREGEFGFLINYETGKVEIRGSTSGSLIPGALALAAQGFQEPRYRSVAEASAELFRLHDLAWGAVSGGPGDAVQVPDGESIFGLVESFITLYEATRAEKWLDAARHAVAIAASWAISFDYEFPPGSTLAQLGMDARGTMFANAQNKCGVPGICTLSGQGLLRTFRASGDIRILNVLREIAHSIPQFLSHRDRPIPARITWGEPLPFLPTGYICERVNVTPSWPEEIGEQAAYSCWCEVAMMLTWNDLPGVYAQPDTGLISALDHVTAEWTDATLTTLKILNPTNFHARVRLLVETSSEARNRILPANFAASLPVVSLPPGASNLHPATNP